MSESKKQTIKILLVEDSEFDVQQIRRALHDRRIGNDLIHYDNAEQAWEHMADESNPLIDLILLDLNLPVMSGHDLLEQLREDPRLANICVMILTTSDQEEDIIRSYGNFADAYIHKPFDVGNFLDHFCQQSAFEIDLVRTPVA